MKNVLTTTLDSAELLVKPTMNEALELFDPIAPDQLYHLPMMKTVQGPLLQLQRFRVHYLLSH